MVNAHKSNFRLIIIIIILVNYYNLAS